MAFPLSDYVHMLHALREAGYHFGPVRRYWEPWTSPFIFLRHDVDRFVSRAVRMAEAEHDAGFSSTYYFRCRPGGRFPDDAIRKIAALGHEIGYHYEVVARAKGNEELANRLFCEELASLRATTEVVTVAAHGSPLSCYSNMQYSNALDLPALDLLGEPQVHMDFSRILYITDTGGVFGSPHNRRDWAGGKNLRTPTPPHFLLEVIQPETEAFVLLTTHPERWPKGRAAVMLQRALDWSANTLKTWRGGETS